MQLAHIAEDGRQQTAREHCQNTACYAADALQGTGLESAAYLAGLIHDMGKYQHEFQDYLLSEDQKRGSVIHTFQGCRMILERYHQDGAARYEDITSELIAYAAGAHHGQFDLVDEQQRSGFGHRMNSERAVYNEAAENFLKECASQQELDGLFQKANAEMMPVYEKINCLIREEDGADELYFYIGLLSRLLLSAVIQGDRKDTAEFMTGYSLKEIDRRPEKFWLPYLEHMEKRLETLPDGTDIQKARRSISDQCRAFADMPSGIYRLNVPTGAGKTLSSLRFALAHAAKYSKKRIIFTAPLLTIIDQNAAVIREYIGDDSIILEHHSNVVNSDSDGESLDRKELLEESWDAPVIITSMAQLLLTFFSGKTSSVRRFQALCGSVIIIDEVQTVPDHMLSMFNLTLNFLASVCNVTFVLCSATQPAFESAVHPLRLSQQQMVPYQKQLWKNFERTKITDEGGCRLADIPGKIRSYFTDSDNVLLICNTKKEAQEVFRSFKDTDIYCLHLSASMCMEHRRKVLKKTRRAIEASKNGSFKFLLVSTQVIEAGVDISFDCVVRLLAGMDSVIQAAGRCNRNGEKKEASLVHLIECTDEKLGNLRIIKDAKTASVELLEAFRSDSERYCTDLASDASIRKYYEILYKEMPEGYQDYTTKDGKDTLLSMLSLNLRSADGSQEDAGKYFMPQAFRSAGGLFEIFDTQTTDVVVPYGEGGNLIADLYETEDLNPGYMQSWIQAAKPYAISLYQEQIDKMGKGSVTERGGVFLLSDGWYDEDTGFTMEKAISGYMEV